jgi:hypothetical protein
LVSCQAFPYKYPKRQFFEEEKEHTKISLKPLSIWAGVISVPEPATIALLGWGGAVLLRKHNDKIAMAFCFIGRYRLFASQLASVDFNLYIFFREYI